MKTYQKVLLGLAVGGAGFAAYRVMYPPKYRVLAAPAAPGARMSLEVPSSAGPWRASRLYDKAKNDFERKDNGLREKGKRYAVTVRSDKGSADVEGYWKGGSSNKVPGVLRVTRVLSATTVRPEVPFDLEVPASASSENSDYLETSRWGSIHASSVSEEAREGNKPKAGAPVMYAMRERNQLGNAVLVLKGKALADDSSYWPEDDVDPSSAVVLCTVDDVVRTVRGSGGDVPLPSVFVVPVENLIHVPAGEA